MRRFKPEVTIRTHLLVASLIWTVVGGGLLLIGVSWAMPMTPFWLLAFALSLGTLKSLFVLDRVAERNCARLQALSEKSCFGGVYSIKMWFLVLVMVAMGRLLRASSMPRVYVGLLYFVIGWGLLLSSRLIWRTWHQHRQGISGN